MRQQDIIACFPDCDPMMFRRLRVVAYRREFRKHCFSQKFFPKRLISQQKSAVPWFSTNYCLHLTSYDEFQAVSIDFSVQGSWIISVFSRSIVCPVTYLPTCEFHSPHVRLSTERKNELLSCPSELQLSISGSVRMNFSKNFYGSFFKVRANPSCPRNQRKRIRTEFAVQEANLKDLRSIIAQRSNVNLSLGTNNCFLTVVFSFQMLYPNTPVNFLNLIFK